MKTYQTYKIPEDNIFNKAKETMVAFYKEKQKEVELLQEIEDEYKNVESGDRKTL